MKSRIILIIFLLYILGTLVVYNIFINKAEKELNKNFIVNNTNVKNLYLMGWEDFPKEIIDKFNKEYPYIRINFEKADKHTYSSLLKARIASKVQVDIMEIMPGDYKDFVYKDFLVDLSGDQFLNYYTEKAREQVKRSSSLKKEYVVCYKSYTYGVWYNKTLFERWGVKIPTNYKEFLESCQKLKDKDIAPLVLGIRDDWYSNYIYLLRLPQIGEYEKGLPVWQRGVRIDFEDKDVKTMIEDIEQFAEQGNLMQGSKYLTYYQAFNEFSKGKAAMIIMDDSSLSLVNRNLEKVMEPGIFPIPYKDEGVVDKVPQNNQGLMLGIFSNSTHKEEAKIFLEYLSRPEIAQMYCNLMGFPPNIQGVNSKQIKYDELWEPLRTMAETQLSIDSLDSESLEQLDVHLKSIIKKVD